MAEEYAVREPCQRCDELIVQDKLAEAIRVLKPMEEAYPYNADVHYYLGYAHAKANYPWQAVFHYRKALEISADPAY